MDTPPQKREDVEISTTAERYQQKQLAMKTDVLSATPEWGERLLPYLVAAMETCWVDAVLIALASANIFQRGTTLMPLWAPFVLIASACWLMIFLERREIILGRNAEDGQKRVSGSAAFILLMVLLVLIVVWGSIYASLYLLVDPRWLLALLNDLFQLDGNFRYGIVLVALSVYFCWRGVRLARRTIEPGSVFWMLRLGMGIIIIAIIVHVGSRAEAFNELVLFGIVPLFLFFALVAHALAKAVFVRRSSPGGLQGSVGGQERAILTIMSIIGLIILLLTLGTGSFASPAFLIDVQRGLEPVGRFYDWLVNIIAYGVTFLFYPIVWLLSLIHIKTRPPQIQDVRTPALKRIQGQGPDPVVTIIVPVLKIVLPLLFMVLMIRLILILLKRRRVRLMRTEQEELFESIWSWNLFLTQLKAIWLAIWLRFFPGRMHEQEVVQEGMSGGATARGIRAIYRALLRWAASRGYGHRREETPYEFEERLQQKFPQSEPELGSLTEAYSKFRYGGEAPGEEEEACAQTDWATLQRKFLPS